MLLECELDRGKVDILPCRIGRTEPIARAVTPWLFDDARHVNKLKVETDFAVASTLDCRNGRNGEQKVFNCVAKKQSMVYLERMQCSIGASDRKGSH